MEVQTRYRNKRKAEVEAETAAKQQVKRTKVVCKPKVSVGAQGRSAKDKRKRKAGVEVAATTKQQMNQIKVVGEPTASAGDRSRDKRKAEIEATTTTNQQVKWTRVVNEPKESVGVQDGPRKDELKCERKASKSSIHPMQGHDPKWPVLVIGRADLWMQDGKIYVALPDGSFVPVADFLATLSIPDAQPILFRGDVPEWVKAVTTSRENQWVIQNGERR